MKIKTHSGFGVSVRIEQQEFGRTWLRIDKHLIGFNTAQLHDLAFVIARVAVITQIEFAIAVDEYGEPYWAHFLEGLEAEFKKQQREANVVKPRVPRAKVRAGGQSDDWD
jgi:hypothetical protein